MLAANIINTVILILIINLLAGDEPIVILVTAEGIII